jgi:hypothetical protein
LTTEAVPFDFIEDLFHFFHIAVARCAAAAD